ncbi:hypothetical protein HBI29_180520 [Parastagonospora nodorum]|nr:hypothetical protein HBH49_192650 [Parastagonospora nodorum]KAH4601039.1 hypothetical protein HBH82_182730 [Parastagonospora nodorum]KAH4674842.1 hypothetical protein HBH78_164900 [Parastagonospora nodorum]KAH5302459.1 hypothetical protein HBI12_183840 [Parastagonospora nodorum]KAH5496360.1 hypothetical protein HBI29_180520 [Parastagonospora nodorum]
MSASENFDSAKLRVEVVKLQICSEKLVGYVPVWGETRGLIRASERHIEAHIILNRQQWMTKSALTDMHRFG